MDKDAEDSSIIETLKKQFPPGVATFDLRTTLQQFSNDTKIDVCPLFVCLFVCVVVVVVLIFKTNTIAVNHSEMLIE